MGAGDRIKKVFASAFWGCGITLLLLLVANKTSTNPSWSNAVVCGVWAFFVVSFFWTAPVSHQLAIPRVLWTSLFAGLVALCLYYVFWIPRLAWPRAFDDLDKREAYATRTFSLSREKGETISLGPCPSEKCLEIGLGQLVNTEDGLEQEVIFKSDIGVKFNPKSGLLFQMDAMLEGARLVAGKDQSSAWFLLRQGGGFSLRTHRADVIFTVVDLQADNLKVKLEIKPSSLAERRKARQRPVAPTPDKGVSPP